MAKMPNNSIPKFQTMFLKYLIVEYVQWKNFSLIHVIPNLPTNAAFFRKNPDEFFDDSFLRSKVRFDRLLYFIFLANIIWRRRDNQVKFLIIKRTKHLQCISVYHLMVSWIQLLDKLADRFFKLVHPLGSC